MMTPPNTTNATSLEQRGLASTIDLLELLWRRKVRVVLVAALCVAAGLLYYVEADRIYEAKAEVLLVQKNPESLTGDSRYESGFEDYVATHQALIVSPLIIERAIEAAGLQQLETFSWVTPEDDLAEIIGDQLLVYAGPRELGENADSIMTLAFYGSVPEECPVVVQAVLDSYRSFLGEIYADMSGTNMRLIEQARDLLQTEMQTQEQNYIDFRQSSPLVARGTDEINPLQDRLTSIETQRSELLIRQAEIEAQLASLENARQQDYNPEQLVALVSDLRNDRADAAGSGTSGALESQLLQLADREQELLQHFGENHPLVTNLRRRIEATRQMLAMPTTAYLPQSQPADEATATAESIPLNPEDYSWEQLMNPQLIQEAEAEAEEADRNPIELYAAYLQQELDRVDNSIERLTKLYEQEHARAKELSSFQLKDERFRRNMDRTQLLYDSLIGQLQNASLVREYGGFDARVIAPPQEGEKVRPSGKIVVAGSGLFGIFLGAMLALLAEMRDKSFRSRHDVQQRLGTAVIAEIPQFTPRVSQKPEDASADVGAATALHANLCAYHQPRSPQSEAFRGLRTTLLFSPEARTRKLLLVSGPSPGDGASTIAANLAISVAQLGRQVLLIDSDWQRPRQHELFGLDNETGLMSVISGEQSLASATRTTRIAGLRVLPAGPALPSASDAYATAAFGRLLTETRDKYELVIIDSEPLLAVSDPCVLAPQTDGILLALTPTHDSRWRAGRAQELLDTVGVVPLGVVVNGVGGGRARSYTEEMQPYETSFPG